MITQAWGEPHQLHESNEKQNQLLKYHDWLTWLAVPGSDGYRTNLRSPDQGLITGVLGKASAAQIDLEIAFGSIGQYS